MANVCIQTSTYDFAPGSHDDSHGLLHKVEFPTITVTLVGRDEWSDRIDIHLSGCVLERCEGDDGIKTVVRASWLSWKGREILFAETA